MAAISLVLGDQLFDDISALPKGPIIMVEDGDLARHARYHPKKLILTFAAMRHFAAKLGDRVEYHPLSERNYMWRAIEEALHRHRATQIHTFEPADAFFRRALEAFSAASGTKLVLHRNPMFLTSGPDWAAYTVGHRRRLMADFYTWQRRRLGILVTESGDPVGGQWSFDAENRRRLPTGILLPPPPVCPPDALTREVIAEVQSEFPLHPGRAEGFSYPVNHSQAHAWLETFLEERLDDFGAFEDAIASSQTTLFHSVLSPMLNIGLLTPAEVIHRTLERHRQRPVPLNSLEGFVRQIIGWREFVRGIDRDYETMNLPTGPFRHTRRLNPCWYDGSTGLPPLDTAILRARDHAYCHHIERLMVIGSAMLMCEVEPLEANRWFMEMFIDAAEWVMRPNVLGMSQFADGGYFATKPYLSGSNYLLKMSDYPKGPWCDVWDGLYWRFIDRNREFLAGNHRLSVMVKGVERLDPLRRDRIFAAAESFIDRTTSQLV